MRRRTLMAVAAIGSALVVAGSSTYILSDRSSAREGSTAISLDPSDGEPELHAVLTSPSREEVVFPSDNVRLSEEQNADIETAVLDLQDECLLSLGLDTIPVVPDLDLPDEGPAYDTLRDAPYGVQSANIARESGYHEPPPSAASRAVDEFFRENPLSDEATQALSQGGACAGSGAQQLQMQALRDAEVELDNLNAQAAELMRADSRMSRLNAAWSECMASHGYEYGNPWDPYADGQWDLESTRASRVEIEAAVADVGCKESVNYVGIALALEQSYQERLLQANPGLVQRVQLAGRDTLAAASAD